MVSHAEQTAEENQQEFEAAALAALYAALGGLVFVFFYLRLMQSFAYFMILSIFLAAVGVTAGGSAYCFKYAAEIGSSASDYSMTVFSGVCLAIFALIALVYMLLMCKRMELTANILSAVSGVLAGLPGVVGLAYLVIAGSLAWVVLWMMAVTEINYDIDSADVGIKILLNFWLIVVFFWGAAVLDGILQVTVSTVVATWYFEQSYLDKGMVCCKPAAWNALGRACTKQLGQISFGALVLSFLRALITSIEIVKKQVSDTNFVAKMILCCVQCLLKCIESCLNWVTGYAYVYVAIYGVSFVKAGSEVLELLGEKGLDMVASTSFVEPVLWAGALLGGGCGVFWGELARQSLADVPHWIPYTAGFLGGFLSVAVGLSLVTSGQKTLLVAYAEEPGVLREKKPELAEKWGEGNKLVKDEEKAKGGGWFGGSSNA